MVALTKIEPRKAYFIKLGVGGEWEQECFTNGTIRFGYADFPFEEYAAGNWDNAKKFWQEFREGNATAASNDITQIRAFFEADEETLWITFANGCLYWCISQPDPQEHFDGGSVLNTVNGWHKSDINGNTLTRDKLSGALLKTQGFRGTICSVSAFKYLLRKINNELLPELKEADDAQKKLEQALVPLMKGLTPEDFEIFVELMFSRSGWQRLGDTGKTLKTVDIELLMPVTGERSFVQVKCSADRKTLDDYALKLEQHKVAQSHSKMFFAWHTGDINIINQEYPDIILLNAEKLASMCLNTGLTAWLMEKAHNTA